MNMVGFLRVSLYLIVVLLDFVVRLECFGENKFVDLLLGLLGGILQDARVTHVDVLPRRPVVRGVLVRLDVTWTMRSSRA